MANEIALRLLASPGSEVIVERLSHIFNYEVAGPAALSGIQLLPLEGKKGILTWKDIEKNIRPKFHQFPLTSCISLENTHNNGGGIVYPIELIREISRNAKKLGIKMHLDGARLFNACVKSGIKVYEYGKYFDIVNICLSKSLGCPGGSVLVGNKELIEKAILVRRQMGGSMRQITGYMAAAGLYALENNIDRLAEDHKHAEMIADAIEASPEYTLLEKPETNMVLFVAKNKTPEEVCEYFKKKSILVAPYNYPVLRIVTHLDITPEMVEKIVDAFK
jgi:threonine aldolase